MTRKPRADTQYAKIAAVADTLDSLHGALSLPLPAAMHVTQMLHQTTALRDELRSVYVALTGDDPWATHPRG